MLTANTPQFFEMSQILRTLSAKKKTGYLTLHSAHEQTAVSFNNGKIINLDEQRLSALHHVLTEKIFHYEFKPQLTEPQPNYRLSVYPAQLLLDLIERASVKEQKRQQELINEASQLLPTLEPEEDLSLPPETPVKEEAPVTVIEAPKIIEIAEVTSEETKLEPITSTETKIPRSKVKKIKLIVTCISFGFFLFYFVDIISILIDSIYK
jgi:hypothetical protein